MARIRSVKPSLRTSRVVRQWPFEVRYFWVLLWGYLDDEGRGLDIPRNISADCFPLEDIPAKRIDQWLTLMATTRRDPDRDPPVCRYEVAGVRYLHATHWRDDSNQRVNRPTPSRIPPCPTHEKRSEWLSESPSNHSRPEGEGVKEREKEGEGALTESPSTTTGPATTGGPPPRTCPQHPDGTDDPCRACQRARQAHDDWQTARGRRVATAAKCRKHRGQLAATCSSCAADRKAGAA